MNQRALALVFTALMLASSLPASEATHVAPLTPELQLLPHVVPGQSCTNTQVAPDILARVNKLRGADPTFFSDPLGAPAVCVGGTPDPNVVFLVQNLDLQLENLRNISLELQRQVDARLETTLPEGSYDCGPSAVENDQLDEACALVEPTTVLLDDDFDGTRKTGFGDWQVITERGDGAAWHLESTVTVNGTRTSYRFGDADGYAQGAHQWLISPEIDLTALNGNRTIVRQLVDARDAARIAAFRLCNTITFGNGISDRPGGSQLYPVCGEGQAVTRGSGVSLPTRLDAIVHAYDLAFNETIMSLPVMQHGAYVDLTYRMNFAPGEDGVRLWVYSGDRAPDRSILYNEKFGDKNAFVSCPHEAATGQNPLLSTVNATLTTSAAGPVECTPQLRGGEVVETPPIPGMQETKAFTLADAALRSKPTALSGDVRDFVTARVNLTGYMQERIWVLFEVKTLRNDRGLDTFHDPGRFGRQADYGFELRRIHAEGDGFHRNLRLKDVGATYPYVLLGNAYGDDPKTVRTTLPPGNESIRVWVHNAGDYTENATLTLDVSAAPPSLFTPSFSHVGTYTEPLTLKPDEVKDVRVPWSRVLASGATLREGYLYELAASVTFQDVNARNASVPGATNGPPGHLPSTIDPNDTAARTPNAAGGTAGTDARVPTEAGTEHNAGTTEVTRLVRAATARNLTPVRADGGSGVALQFCSAVEGVSCTEHYAGRKGEPRLALMGVRNDGNVAQDVTARLSIKLDGLDKNDIVTDEPVRVLRDLRPGETRAVVFTLLPTDPGAYDVAVILERDDRDHTQEPPVERRLFVQRSTGILCLDTIEARECGPSFQGGLVPILRGENVTAAALGPDGTVYVATHVADPAPQPDGSLVHSGQLAARDPAGAWRIIANLSRAQLNERLGSTPVPEAGWGDVRAIVVAPDSSLFLLGDNNTALRVTLAGVMTVIPVVAERANITTAIWHADTLVAAGTNGTMLRYDGKELSRFLVKNTSAATSTKITYNGTIHALAQSATGQAIAVGEGGVMFRHSPGDALNVWGEVMPNGANVSAEFVGNKTTLRGAHARGDELYVFGDGVILASADGATDHFVKATPPAPIQNVTLPMPAVGFSAFRTGVTTKDGELGVLDFEGRLATCDACLAVSPDWLYHALAAPPVVTNGPAHPARITHALGDERGTYLLGEAGAFLSLEERGDYENLGDWTTVSSVQAHDGGVLQTLRTNAASIVTSDAQALLAFPDAAGQAVADAALRFQFFMNHSAPIVTTGSAVEARLVYVAVPTFSTGPTFSTAPGELNQTCQPASLPQSSVLTRACHDGRVRQLVASQLGPSPVDGWQAVRKLSVPTAQELVDDGASSEQPGAFFALELYAGKGTRWAIDDFHLLGCSATGCQTVVAWRGPDASTRTGEIVASQLYDNIQHVRPFSANAVLNGTDADEIVSQTSGQPRPGGDLDATLRNQLSLQDGGVWDVLADKRLGWPTAFDQTPVSPWHLASQYANAPVFAANNEFYLPGHSGGNLPRLMDNWDARLVSPTIDLTHAYDPVVSFRHAFSFRTQPIYNGDLVLQNYGPGDGGLLEVQYLRTGAECGSVDPRASCGWSPFYVVEPEGGYTPKARFGVSSNVYRVSSAMPLVPDRVGDNRSFWGSQAEPDATGVISGPRSTDTYEEVKVNFGDNECNPLELEQLRNSRPVDCLPVNVTGRQIRFAFRILTAGDPIHAPQNPSGFTENAIFNATLHSSREPPTSFPGEGWYITDFKVLGASTLGIDLVAKEAGFRVGYDVANIGVGPDTRVPVNVTVHNSGTFDALGYTVRLEVLKVLNRALKETQLVDTIVLPQQPVLEANKSVNHTIVWRVPPAEGAEYVLNLHVDPIGIARDEDFLDNVAHIGTTSQPVIAHTVRKFRTEFLVSPENATIDITRYMPMYINNTGNVPIDRFTLERRISIIGRAVDRDATTCDEWRRYVDAGRQTAIADCQVWNLTGTAPAGELTLVTRLSEEVSPTDDLYWKAPERANFLVSLSARTGAGSTLLTSGMDRRVSAFATYLFDDVERGARGESFRGDWVIGPGWDAVQPGFRSTDSYAFADRLADGAVTLERYPADANSSIESPTLLLGNARTANVAWFQKYEFEPGFDGGAIEASDDGGKTWTRLTPLSSSKTRAGYNASAGYAIQPSSALHISGDPSAPAAYAFTGDSSLHPASVDGWVLSEVDLTGYPNVTENAVEYEAYTSVELQHYPESPRTPNHGVNGFYSKDWCPGAVADFRCWEIQDLTRGTNTPPTPVADANGERTMWWSGSPARDDDGLRPVQNHLLEIPVSLAGTDPDEVVVADWWEYASRFGEGANYARRGQPGSQKFPDDLYTVFSFQSAGTPASTYRYNLGQPQIVENKGRWYHMQSDITSLVKDVKAQGKTEMKVAFAYSPVREYAFRNMWTLPLRAGSTCEGGPGFDCGPDNKANTTDDTVLWTSGDIAQIENGTGALHYQNVYSPGAQDAPGFAIDGFKITATRLVRGQPLGDPKILIDENTAWDAKRVYECGTGHAHPGIRGTGNPWNEGGTATPACLTATGTFTPDEFVRRAPMFPEDTYGRNWARVTEIPGVTSLWGVVDVSRDGYDAAHKLPTGDIPKAWWSGMVAHSSTPQGGSAENSKCGGETGTLLRMKRVPCPQPLSESRLTTPMFDLGRVAGNNAQLSFTQRFAFGVAGIGRGVPLASGGVVEISEFDAVTGQWSAWKQLYESTFPYNGITSNTTQAADGPRRYDPPFETLRAPDGTTYQRLYTGRSTTITADGWIPTTYDLHDYLGKKVRFGFHYFMSDRRDFNGATAARLPDVEGTDDLGGWWIADVSIVGNVLVGKPVQLRLRAGSDANVQDGSWQVDDFGVYGSRYRNNVGIFVDEGATSWGAYNDSSVRIPVTIRNLGETVRRDLAVEIINAEPLVALNFTAGPKEQVAYATDPERFYISGITLGPGQSRTVEFIVSTPSTWPSLARTTLLFNLREFSPADPQTPFVKIVDNEVQGLLTRSVPFNLQRQPTLVVLDATVRQATLALDQVVRVEIDYVNELFGAANITDLTCTAATVSGWEDANHAVTTDDTPTVVAEYPCVLAEGSLLVAPKTTSRLAFDVTPTKAGFLIVEVKANATSPRFEGAVPLRDQRVGVPVGVSPTLLSLPFDNAQEVRGNFSFLTSAGWEYLRGHDAPGSLFLGVQDNLSAAGISYNACPNLICRATTGPIDLHNYSRVTPAYLSFWHMDRFARYDGAQVRAQRLINELRPTATGAPSWSTECILRPVSGYEGPVTHRPGRAAGPNNNPPATPGDQNGINNTRPQTYGTGGTQFTTDDDFFTSPAGWENGWSLAVFDLSAPCVTANYQAPVEQTLVGSTIRLQFELFVSQSPTNELRRGAGQGWFIDDISIGELSLGVTPTTPQTAALLDNSTKTFHMIVENKGPLTDRVRFEYDALNSSAPADSVRVPSEVLTLPPHERRIVKTEVTLPRDPSLLPTDFKVRLAARSVIDPNAAGTTVVDVAFAPRPWPELALTATAPRGVVQEGTETFIPLTIENTGLVDSKPTTIRIVDTWGANGRVETILDVPAITSFATDPEGASRVLEFRWRPEKGSIGAHSLTFELDPDALSEEYTRVNNRVSFSATVSELLVPDLHVANFSALVIRNAAGALVSPAFDADVARYEVTAGELVSFEIKVANLGRSGATNVSVRPFIGSLSLPPKSIPYIGPGSEAVVTLNWLAQKGEHEIEFDVRQNCDDRRGAGDVEALGATKCIELSLTNNRYPGKGVTLLTVKGYEVEVDIPPILALLEPASEIRVPFTITNTGNAGEDLLLRASAPSGMQISLRNEGFFLRQGQVYEGEARLVLDAEAVAGEQFISIEAVARENPMKVASGRAPLRVNATYGGSVTGGLAVGSPPRVTIPVELVNEGNSLEPWALTVRLPPGWSSDETMPAQVVVPAHGRLKYEFHVNVPVTTAPGDRVLQIKATMPNGEKRDGLVRTTITALRAASVAVSEGVPQADHGALIVPVTVENKGNVQQPFSIVVVDAPAGLGLRVEPATFDLPPGGKAVAQLVMKPNASIESGTYPIVGYTRFEGVQPSTPEGRANMQSLRVAVVRQDLRLSPLEFAPRAGLDAGDRVSVKVQLTNRGLAELTDVPVHLFVDDVFVDETLVPAIAAGGRADVTFNWTALPGVHTLTAVADPYSDTVDADRADNAVSALATVGSDVPTGGVAAGRADAPGLGAFGLIAGLCAAALLATRGNGRRRQRR